MVLILNPFVSPDKNTLLKEVLGIDIGGKYKIICSTGKQFRDTSPENLAISLMLYCETNHYKYIGIENIDLLSANNTDTRKLLTVIERVSRQYHTKIIRVDPMKTSKICHRCHTEANKSRTTNNVFFCIFCNLKVSSDYNASINIRQRAIDCISG